MRSELYVPRARCPIPRPVISHETLPPVLRRLPWKIVSGLGARTLNQKFAAAIDAADPQNTIAYFWPDPPLDLIRRAKQRGILTVREMINSYRGTAKTILDEAYEQHGLEPDHGISVSSVTREREELGLYDYVFASRQVELSLAEAGVAPARILPGGFGWSARRWRPHVRGAKTPGLKALFVGTIGVRKGAPQLLDAWCKSNVSGELVLVGDVEKAMKPIISKYEGKHSVRILRFTDNIAALYGAADVFVFPTFEEGDPRVTYEAASFGLPVITTPMGAGRIVRHEENGLIVRAGDVEELTSAIGRIARSESLRSRLSMQAAQDAANFTYERLAQERAIRLAEILDKRNSVRELALADAL